MENLLPILLGLIFFGIKHYNKSQKEKAAKNIPVDLYQEDSQNTNSSLDDFMEQFYSNAAPEASVSTPPVTVIEEPAFHEEETWMEKMHRQEPESIEYTAQTARDDKHKPQFEMNQNKQPQTTEGLDFDLRKAIVYDAIMNPPYL